MIDTAASLTSVGLAIDGKVVSYKESTKPREQASQTAPYIKEVLEQNNLKAKDCNAVCISMGPGSYTGLRVGMSTAKGICFGGNVPLIGVGTLELLANQAIDEDLLPEGCEYIVPMIDARRMEVYACVFNKDAERLTETEPKIIEEDSFADFLEKGKVLFIGDGAEKCKDVIKHENAFFMQCNPKASALLNPAMKAFEQKDFKDIAYTEPFYLKQFVAIKSKKKLF